MPVQVDVLALERPGQLSEQMLAALDAQLVALLLGPHGVRVDQVEQPRGVRQLALLAPTPDPAPQEQLANRTSPCPPRLRQYAPPAVEEASDSTTASPTDSQPEMIPVARRASDTASGRTPTSVVAISICGRWRAGAGAM